jgi:ABC-2 type transport system ATP-binding protein
MSCPDRLAPALVHVQDISKHYGCVTALSGVSLTLHYGEILGLIGPNGSGKTTLFECVAGVLPADAGAVLVNGRSVPPGDRASLLFYLPDAIAPWPAQTVRWTLDYALGFFGGRAGVRDELVHRFGLGPFLDSRVGSLSKGQRKRALLAVGMLMPQSILLADEPFDSLDLRQTREAAAALREHAFGSRTLFLSIHQISDAARICDRFVLLSGGKVCGEGTLDELAALAAARTGLPLSRNLEEVFLALT